MDPKVYGKLLTTHRRGLGDDVEDLCGQFPPYARSLAHARSSSQDEEKILLLPPFTPRPYYLG